MPLDNLKSVGAKALFSIIRLPVEGRCFFQRRIAPQLLLLAWSLRASRPGEIREMILGVVAERVRAFAVDVLSMDSSRGLRAQNDRRVGVVVSVFSLYERTEPLHLLFAA